VFQTLTLVELAELLQYLAQKVKLSKDRGLNKIQNYVTCGLAV
jgi:hypothetical protein